MKKMLAVLAALVLLLLLTNPGLPAHRAAVLEDLQSRFATGEGAKIAASLGPEYIARDNERTVSQRVARRNYGLFSLTQINYTDLPSAATRPVLSRTVGIGILGQVYLWSGM